MLHGVIINGTNTLSAHGLILLDDLRIEEPTKKENRINYIISGTHHLLVMFHHNHRIANTLQLL